MPAKRRRRHRHLARQDQRRLLEQQRKTAARPRPRHRHPLDPVIRAIDPRHPCRDEAVVLEEVQVPPGEALEVVRLAGPLAVRAREQRATVGDHLESLPSGLTRGCSSCGRFSTSNRCPASFHGALKPSPSENTSFGSIPPPSMLQSPQHARPRGRIQPSADSIWNVEEPEIVTINLSWGQTLALLWNYPA